MSGAGARRRYRKARAKVRPSYDYRQYCLRKLVDEHGWTCAICGKPINPRAKVNSRGRWSLDHIVALEDGGASRIENFQLTHTFCNWSRHHGPGLDKPAKVEP